MEFVSSYIEYMSVALEVAGITVIVIGALWSILQAGFSSFSDTHKKEIFRQFRKTLGKGILLGLEFLVAADIINTVVIEPTIRSVAVLSIIILIRTFLSFTLEVEMDGKWPWQKRQ